MSHHLIFKNAQMVLRNELVDGSLSVENGLISAVAGPSAAPGAIEASAYTRTPRRVRNEKGPRKNMGGRER